MKDALGAFSAAKMNLRIDDQIVVEGRVLVVLGFDPFGVPAARITVEDGATGEPVTELIARMRQARACDPARIRGRHARLQDAVRTAG